MVHLSKLGSLKAVWGRGNRNVSIPSSHSSSLCIFAMLNKNAHENVEYLRQTDWIALSFIFSWYKSAAQAPNLIFFFYPFKSGSSSQAFYYPLPCSSLMLTLIYLFWATLSNFLELHAIPICSKSKRDCGNTYLFKAGTTKTYKFPYLPCPFNLTYLIYQVKYFF